MKINNKYGKNTVMEQLTNGKFQIGNTVATAKAGKKHQSTMIKQMLSNCISDVDSKLYEITFELLNSKNQKVRAFGWKELLKYRLPKNIEIKDTNPLEINIKYI